MSKSQTHNHNNGQAANHAGKPDPGRNLRQSIEATCPNAASNFSATHAEFNHSGYAILAANLRGTHYKPYKYWTTLGHLASFGRKKHSKHHGYDEGSDVIWCAKKMSPTAKTVCL